MCSSLDQGAEDHRATSGVRDRPTGVEWTLAEEDSIKLSLSNCVYRVCVPFSSLEELRTTAELAMPEIDPVEWTLEEEVSVKLSLSLPPSLPPSVSPNNCMGY